MAFIEHTVDVASQKSSTTTGGPATVVESETTTVAETHEEQLGTGRTMTAIVYLVITTDSQTASIDYSYDADGPLTEEEVTARNAYEDGTLIPLIATLKTNYPIPA